MNDSTSWMKKSSCRYDGSKKLRFRLRFQLGLPVLQFHRIFHRFAAIVLPELCGLLLDEFLERIQVRRIVFPGLPARLCERLEERFHLFLVRIHIRERSAEWAVCRDRAVVA